MTTIDTQPETEVPTVTEPRTLNALDRCDVCGAQAYMAVQFPSTAEVPNAGELLFCSHHGDKYETDLVLSITLDNRAALQKS